MTSVAGVGKPGSRDGEAPADLQSEIETAVTEMLRDIKGADGEGKPLFTAPQRINAIEAAIKWFQVVHGRDDEQGWGEELGR